MKRKQKQQNIQKSYICKISSLIVLAGMLLTSCKSVKLLENREVQTEKSQKSTAMENQESEYDLPVDEEKKKEVVNDCEAIMDTIWEIYSEFHGIQEADQNAIRQMMNRMKEVIRQTGDPVIGSIILL